MARDFDAPAGATPFDSKGLIPDGVLTYPALCEAEAENILSAVNKHLRRRKNSKRPWFTEPYARRVHRDMFCFVWEWAGCYRESGLNIGIAAHGIREEMAKLCRDVQFWDGQTSKPMSIVERAARIHHRLAWIHPFPNGNGRHARLMADIYLRAHSHPLPVWPSENIEKAGNARAEYLGALRAADRGNFGPLTQYTCRFIPES